MWNNLVSNSDVAVRHLQAAFSDEVASHPTLMVGAVAGALAMIATHWAAVADAELRALRTQRTVRAWPIRPTR